MKYLIFLIYFNSLIVLSQGEYPKLKGLTFDEAIEYRHYKNEFLGDINDYHSLNNNFFYSYYNNSIDILSYDNNYESDSVNSDNIIMVSSLSYDTLTPNMFLQTYLDGYAVGVWYDFSNTVVVQYLFTRLNDTKQNYKKGSYGIPTTGYYDSIPSDNYNYGCFLLIQLHRLGIMSVKIRYYYPNHKIKRVEHWRNGNAFGIWDFYTKSGEILGSYVFEKETNESLTNIKELSDLFCKQAQEASKITTKFK